MFFEIKAPDGFRAISSSQAVMEYGKPLLDKLAEEGDLEEMNEALQLTSLLWNYTLFVGQEREKEKKRKEVVRQLKGKLKITEGEAVEFLKEMVERKSYLFPPTIQPEYPMVMFVRKETRSAIAKFNYEGISFSEEPIRPSEEDREMISDLQTLDKYLAEGVDYGEWEDHYFGLEERCHERYQQWLIDKGISEYSEVFSFCVEVYLNYVYRYEHTDFVSLKNISRAYLEEFFYDHLLRKVVVEPQEYVWWLPALKFFQIFLQEKGYLKKAQPILKLLDKIEPHFIEILRQRY